MRGGGGRRERTHKRGECLSVDSESKQGRERGLGGRRQLRQVSRSDSESDQSTEKHFKNARSSFKDTRERKRTRKATDLTPMACIILCKATLLVVAMMRSLKWTSCCLASGPATGTV